MEKTKAILIKLYLNCVDSDFDNSDNELFTVEDLRFSLKEILNSTEFFIVDLSHYISESKKRSFYNEDVNMQYIKKMKLLWENFSIEDLNSLKRENGDGTIKNLISKMIVLKTAYKKFNQDVAELDLEDYFYNKEKLIDLIL